MSDAATSGSAPIRFGVFEVDLCAGELRKNGAKVKLEGQPIQILGLLLERPGQLVTREELKQKLWLADTFVDFEHSINAAVKRLREALNDSAETPRFIETLPRRGYRFIYPINGAAERPAPPSRMGWPLYWRAALAWIALLSGFAGLLAFNLSGLRDRVGGPSSVPPITSVAVLPLENLTGDSQQEYLVDGIHDELVTQVAQISSLKVISRTSVLRYKQTKLPVGEIARQLGVDAVVEGAVQRHGDRVHVSAQLIYAPSDRHLWARSYERPLAEIPALPAEITADLARDLHIPLTPQEDARLANRRPVNPDAYHLYLLGRFHLAHYTQESTGKAVGYFQQAIAKDPNYAPAYASLAEAYDRYESGTFRARPPHEVLPLARAAAWKARELDPNLADAYTVLASTSAEADWDLTSAERYFRQALAVAPGNANAHYWYARLLSGRGRHDEAIAEIERARELDPLSLVINGNVGEIYAGAGRFDQAFTQLHKTLEMDPNYPRTHIDLGLAYEIQGKEDAAVREYQKARALDGENWPELREPLQRAYEAGGVRGYYQTQFRLLKEMSRTRYVSPVYLGLLAARLGDREQALAWFEKAFRERDPGLLPLKDGGDCPAGLQSDPRCQDLLRRIRAAIK